MDASQHTSRSHHYIHCTPEELEHLSPDELLQACLEHHSLLQTITGILATPHTGLTLRVVAADLLYTQAQRISVGQLLDEASPVVYDIQAVSERLGLRPAERGTAGVREVSGTGRDPHPRSAVPSTTRAAIATPPRRQGMKACLSLRERTQERYFWVRSRTPHPLEHRGGKEQLVQVACT
jgi:hypothetical protein